MNELEDRIASLKRPSPSRVLDSSIEQIILDAEWQLSTRQRRNGRSNVVALAFAVVLAFGTLPQITVMDRSGQVSTCLKDDPILNGSPHIAELPKVTSVETMDTFELLPRLWLCDNLQLRVVE